MVNSMKYQLSIHALMIFSNIFENIIAHSLNQATGGTLAIYFDMIPILKMKSSNSVYKKSLKLMM